MSLYLIETPTNSQYEPWAKDLETTDLEAALGRARELLTNPNRHTLRCLLSVRPLATPNTSEEKK